ncbi:MAG: adenylate/guanylate cyclase domain-containing protein [Gemmataceae bacterium]
MTRAIVNEDGVVGDFQGDATMGFWGWPLPQPDQAERAARAALSIRREVRRFAQRRNHPLAGMECGIGVARGPAVAGRLGTYEQAKIGVFGPVVNRAARLEAATKRLGVPILIDAAVYDQLAKPGAVAGRLRKVARVVPKGLAEPLLIAELLPAGRAGRSGRAVGGTPAAVRGGAEPVPGGRLAGLPAAGGSAAGGRSGRVHQAVHPGDSGVGRQSPRRVERRHPSVAGVTSHAVGVGFGAA